MLGETDPEPTEETFHLPFPRFGPYWVAESGQAQQVHDSLKRFWCGGPVTYQAPQATQHLPLWSFKKGDLGKLPYFKPWFNKWTIFKVWSGSTIFFKAKKSQWFYTLKKFRRNTVQFIWYKKNLELPEMKTDKKITHIFRGGKFSGFINPFIQMFWGKEKTLGLSFVWHRPEKEEKDFSFQIWGLLISKQYMKW